MRTQIQVLGSAALCLAAVVSVAVFVDDVDGFSKSSFVEPTKSGCSTFTLLTDASTPVLRLEYSSALSFSFSTLSLVTIARSICRAIWRTLIEIGTHLLSAAAVAALRFSAGHLCPSNGRPIEIEVRPALSSGRLPSSWAR